MKKLSSINVLNRKIKISYSDMEDWGECNIDKKEIKISNKCLKDPEQHWWTLVHEVTHLIFEFSGLAYMENNDEEAYVRCVENLVVPWVLDNLHLRQTATDGRA
jgi:hypothetical protein